MSARDKYINLISTYDEKDKYGRNLLELMDRYEKICLLDITEEEAKKFWEELKERN